MYYRIYPRTDICRQNRWDMTPLEEATQITEMFFHLRSEKMSDYSKIYWPTAKLCATKMVDKIIDLVGKHDLKQYQHYIQVKEEIENL